MNRSRTSLGKGLAALIQPPRYAHLSDDYFQCAIDRVQADPDQPRERFDDNAMGELVASIKEKGIIQPLVVRKAADGDYTVVAGERRLRAARKAGLTEVPVIVKDIADDEVLEIALIENIQREDLDPIEEARAYARLLDNQHYNQDVLARRVGKNRSTVANAVRLLKLSKAHQQLVIDKQLSAGHARCLLSIDDLDTRADLATRIIADQLSVRATEQAARAAKPTTRKPRNVDKPATALSNYANHVAATLSQALGTSVEVRVRGRKGKLTIQFEGTDVLRELSRAYDPTPPPDAPS